MFFFKQKTAYEMRISDWSSDVCSSDLLPARARTRPRNHRPGHAAELEWRRRRARLLHPRHRVGRRHHRDVERSEEHTSELQSLMRISYAVFCLKKNKTHTHIKIQRSQTPIESSKDRIVTKATTT